MKKTILYLPLLLFYLTSFSQEETVSPNYKRLSIGLNLSPDIAYRTLHSNLPDNSIKDLREKSEGPKFGYTGGLNLRYRLTENFSIEGGAQYSNKGYQFKRSDLQYGSFVDPRYGFVYQIVDGAPAHLTINYHFHYLDIPFRSIFTFGENKLSFLGSIGISTNVLLEATSTVIVEYEDGKKEKKNQKSGYDFIKINVSPTISLGVNYKLSEKVNISAEPTFRYGLLEIIDAPITAYLWNGGLSFTFYYGLK